MTTIVYDHKNKQIAIDSRSMVGDLIITDDLIKSKESNGVWFFLSGNNSDINDFSIQYPTVKVTNDLSGFIVKDKEVYTVQIIEGTTYESKISFSDSDGCGYILAIAALDFGKTAKEAIEYVITRSAGTGGKVHVYDIVKGEFI